MPDPHIAFKRVIRQPFFQRRQSSLLFDNAKAVFATNRKAGGIIPPVFQLLDSLNNNGLAFYFLHNLLNTHSVAPFNSQYTAAYTDFSRWVSTHKICLDSNPNKEAPTAWCSSHHMMNAFVQYIKVLYTIIIKKSIILCLRFHCENCASFPK
jgi:hypothetical protein